MSTVREWVQVRGDTVPELIAALQLAQEGVYQPLRCMDTVELFYDRPYTAAEAEREARYLEGEKEGRRRQYEQLKKEFEP